MATPTPSRTTNPLHFEDLDPRRFEDLGLALLYRLRNWEDIHHDGRAGRDAGGDLRAIERLDDGSLRHWVVQCKRYKSFGPTDARAVVSALPAGEPPPDVLLLIVGCDVSLETRQAFEQSSQTAGVASSIVWTSSKLEAMLYADHTDLLFAFFGISMIRKERTRETDLKRSLVLKRKLVKLLPLGKKGEFVLHSIDDDTYPDTIATEPGVISPWFKLEFAGHYHRGIEGYLRVEYIIVDRDDLTWSSPTDPWYFGGDESEIQAALNQIEPRYTVVKTFIVGRIPYSNMIEIDDAGDEYYGSDPHIYCRFCNAGQPYSEIFHREIGGYSEYRNSERFDLLNRLPSLTEFSGVIKQFGSGS